MRAVIPTFVLVVTTAVLVNGCGTKKATTTTTATTATTSATVHWADSACAAIATWKTSVGSAIGSVKLGNINKSSLQAAGGQLESATKTFVNAAKSLGKPDTKAGAQAKQSLAKLSTELRAEQKTIDTAINGAHGVTGVIAAEPTVLGSVKSMRTDVSTTVKQLKSLDGSGELADAFKQASTCTTLANSA
jgi:hypothetical protein